VRAALAPDGIAVIGHKDQVVFEADEVLTAAGTPFSVFTPYKNAWLKRLAIDPMPDHSARPRTGVLAALPDGLPHGVPSLADIGFEPTPMALRLNPGTSGAQALLADFIGRIDAYGETRDFPAVKGPSYLSVHLRFGTLSIRTLARHAAQHSAAGSAGAAVWLSELIWRDFYHQILHHHPHVVTRCFKPAYDAIQWDEGAEADALFAAWCEGRTGYPIVDAAMQQLNQTGYMHNRLRMIVASFLTKDLGLDWRRGEAYFARQLNDFDLAANNGGWQWAASTGCDAQPYFRIFNPVTQSQRFDAEGRFIHRYLPQLAGLTSAAVHAPWQAKPLELIGAGVTLGRDYPRPVVDHATARERTLARFAVVKAGKEEAAG
ncbi:MAG: deoxyribodipyrimidine photo-lyase, partial [Leptothrix sp. (in: b-proteobacteria)]